MRLNSSPIIHNAVYQRSRPKPLKSLGFFIIHNNIYRACASTTLQKFHLTFAQNLLEFLAHGPGQIFGAGRPIIAGSSAAVNRKNFVRCKFILLTKAGQMWYNGLMPAQQGVLVGQHTRAACISRLGHRLARAIENHSQQAAASIGRDFSRPLLCLYFGLNQSLT